jgi:hypothetical protein
VRQFLLSHDKDVDNDIHAFITSCLSSIAADFELDQDWPGESNRRVLVQKSNGLFIWASTAVKFIAERDVGHPKRQLRRLLDATVPPGSDSSPWVDLDSLYLQVIKQAFTQKAKPEGFSIFRTVIGAVITIHDPLTATALCSLLGLDSAPDDLGHTVKLTVRRLQAVLVIPPDKPLEIIHPSFIDFLTNKHRCADENFFINTTLQHHSLAIRCLHVMNGALKPNICGLDPWIPVFKLEDLRHRISTGIPQALQYACRFWALHLSHVGPSAELYQLLETIYLKHMLCWVEVMSLLGFIGEIPAIISIAEGWISVCDCALYKGYEGH